jgi:chromosomal replication initiator protein
LLLLFPAWPFPYNKEGDSSTQTIPVQVVMQTPAAFARFLPFPENRSALVAFRLLAETLKTGDSPTVGNPLFLHGPAGVGKSCLVGALVETACSSVRGLTPCVLSANSFPLPWDQHDTNAPAERFQAACDCDLLVLEDLQHLPARAADTLVQLLDTRLHLGAATVVTAMVGPAQLVHRGQPLPVRLTDRLGGGLVVAMQPMQVRSRCQFLKELARQRDLALTDDILNWLAELLTGGGRQLEGAIHQIEALVALNGKPVSLDVLREQFQVQAETGRPTAERIVRRVSDYFRIEPRQLKSARRHRSLMLPRQVSMYLMRRLTRLSLQQIGACFGGRDHSTVLHACRKIEAAIKSDAVLSGAVDQMHAELT